MTNKTAPRRKKTRKDISKENKRKTVERKVMAPPRHEKPKTQGRLCWSDVESISSSCRDLLTAPSRVVPMLRNKELTDCLENRAEFIRLTKIMIDDLTRCSSDLDAIDAMWAGKCGNASGPDDLILSIDITTKYEMWQVDFNTVVLENYFDIIEMLDKARENREKEFENKSTEETVDVIKENESD